MTRATLTSLIDSGFGRIIAESWVPDPELTLLVMSHEYRVPAQQQNLYLQLEALLEGVPELPLFAEGWSGPAAGPRVASVEQAGGRAIVVEGADEAAVRQVLENPEHRAHLALSRLERSGAQAVEVLAGLLPAGRIRGVEEPGLLSLQKEKLEEIDAKAKLMLSGPDSSESAKFVLTFGVELLGSFVRQLEDSCAGPRLRELLALERQFIAGGDLLEHVRSLIDLARRCGVDLDRYGSTRTLFDAGALEEAIDFDDAERQRLELVERLVDKANESLAGDRAAAMENWLADAPAAERALAARRVEEVPAGTPAWMERLTLLSLAYAERNLSASIYYGRLDDLLAGLGMSVARSGSLARYVDYLRLIATFDCHRLHQEELPALHEELADQLAASENERKFLEVRREFGRLRRFLELQLPAFEVRQTARARLTPWEWLSEALRLVDSVTPGGPERDGSEQAQRRAALMVASSMNLLVPLVTEYYSAASRRSERMTENVLAACAGQEPVAVLVCGRYHLDGCLRLLRRRPKTVWAVFGPASRRERGEGLADEWTWKYPLIEWSMPGAPPKTVALPASLGGLRS